MKEIRALTGLRGAAALFVVLYHYTLLAGTHSVGETFFGHGYLAVDLFFVLSGFVMALTYRHLFADGFSLSSYRIFLTRRVARIYPLYVFMTLVTGVIYFVIPHTNIAQVPFNSSTVLCNLALVQAWGCSQSFIGPGWSISTEFAAYLLFPMLASVLLFRKAWVSLIGVGIAGMVLAWLVYGQAVNDMTLDKPLNLWADGSLLPLLRCLSEFALGVFAYRLAMQDAAEKLFHVAWLQVAISGAIMALLCVPNMDLFIVVLFGALIVAVSYDRGPVSKMLGHGAVHYLGLISYSLYLVHFIVVEFRQDLQDVMERSGAPHAFMLAQAAMFALSLVLAHCLYVGIEKPSRRTLKNSSIMFTLSGVTYPPRTTRGMAETITG